MNLSIVARSRLDRYEELRRDFGDWPGVGIVLDRREGERRAPERGTLAVSVERRRVERRQERPDLRKIGWSVVDTDELGS